MTAAVAPPNPTNVALRDIPARMLTVDHSVQRALDNARVERIAGQFDPNALGTFVVSQRADGSLHLIDGQHRHGVVLILGGEDWPLRCEVHTGLTLADEARMFRLLNNAKPVSILEKFLVRIVEGDPVAVKINDILVEKGWRISLAKTDGVYQAVAAIEKPFRRAGDEGPAVVEWIIDVITKAWGYQADASRNEIITGLGLVKLRHGDAIDTQKLVNELAAIPGGPRGLVGRARSLKEFRRGIIGDAMAELLVNMINNKRRVNRLPSWRDDDPDAAQG